MNRRQLLARALVAPIVAALPAAAPAAPLGVEIVWGNWLPPWATYNVMCNLYLQLLQTGRLTITAQRGGTLTDDQANDNGIQAVARRLGVTVERHDDGVGRHYCYHFTRTAETRPLTHENLLWYRDRLNEVDFEADLTARVPA